MQASVDATSIWDRNLRPATIALITTIALSAFEGLAVAAAIPEITADLGRVSLTSWLLTAYFISSTVATLAAGPIVDQRGIRWTFEASLLLFIAASVACALAPSMPILIAARVVQGFGGGALISVALAAVGLLYPEKLRARQYAAQSAVWGSMSVLGPAAAALFVSTIGWSGVFWINLPFGAWAWFLGRRSLPVGDATTRKTRRRTDLAGLALATAFIFGLIAALSTISPRTAILGSVTLAVGIVWWVHAGRTAQPLLERRHVAANPYRLIGMTIGCGLAAAVSLNLYLPIVIRGSLGRSESAAAFSLLFFSVAWTVGAQITSRLIDRFPGPSVAIGGFCILFLGTLSGALLGTNPSYWGLAVTAAIRGLGIGCASIPYLTELQKHAVGSDFGRINAAHQFYRFVGMIVSIALVGAIMFFVVDQRTGDVEGLRDLLAGENRETDGPLAVALASGYRWAQVAMSAIAIAAIGLAVRTRGWLRASAQIAG